MNIGALWLNESESGKKYMKGFIKTPMLDLPIVIFKVEEKKSDNSPDYQIIWSQPKKQTNTDNQENPLSDDSNIPF